MSRLLDTVRSHCFSHQLEILLPNEDSFTQDLNARLQAIPVGNFCVLQCRLQAFLEPNILDSLISPANEFRLVHVLPHAFLEQCKVLHHICCGLDGPILLVYQITQYLSDRCETFLASWPLSYHKGTDEDKDDSSSVQDKGLP